MDAPDDDRIPLADPAAAQQGVGRSIWAGIAAVVLLTGFTAGGAAMLGAGELPGLPFAVGGALAQVSAIVMLAAVLRARTDGGGASLSRSRLAAASRILNGLRQVLLVALIGLVVYALVRLLLGDPWTLLTGALIGLFLLLLYRGAGRLREGWASVL